FRPGVSGSFTVTATSTDAQSGVASYAFPTLTGFTASGTGAAKTYSWSGSPSSPGAQNVTANNNATLTSAGGALTVSADSTAPSTAIQCNGVACSSGWYTTDPSISLSATDVGGSGVATTRYTTDGSDPAVSLTAVTY